MHEWRVRTSKVPCRLIKISDITQIDSSWSQNYFPSDWLWKYWSIAKMSCLITRIDRNFCTYVEFFRKIFRTPSPSVRGCPKAYTPSPAGRPTFWFNLERDIPQTRARVLKDMITSQTPESSTIYTHTWIFIKITKPPNFERKFEKFCSIRTRI